MRRTLRDQERKTTLLRYQFYVACAVAVAALFCLGYSTHTMVGGVREESEETVEETAELKKSLERLEDEVKALSSREGKAIAGRRTQVNLLSGESVKGIFLPRT